LIGVYENYKMTDTASPQIGVIICSSRQPRVCPQIADFVIATITTANPSVKPNLHLVDLAKWNLPLFDEPLVPSEVKSHSEYSHEHTQAWSLEIQKYQGFIFVLPQYNWGYPAVLKNAIDYLFYEWNGKSAMIVSYGGRGGGKSSAQWREVLGGIRMKVAETAPALAFPSRDVLVLATGGQPMPVMGDGGIWSPEQEIIRRAFGELETLLAPS
jgi:NAD(P)H-dependent FMN reductase